MWTKGFLSESLVVYRLGGPQNAPRFLSDFERATRTGKVDGRYVEVLNDKLLFWLCLRNVSPYIVPVLAALERGRIVYRSEAAPADARDRVELLRRLARPVVIKPTRGGGGSDIQLYEFCDGMDCLNGTPVTRDAVSALLSKDALVICPKVEQASYARLIYSQSTNTLRLLTMYDGEGAFLACAIHRFGTEASRPVDNWGKGGLSVSIDPRTGTLGKGCAFPTDGTLTWHGRHPDSGADIEGVRIPNWDAIRDGTLGIADRLPFLPYVGWDVVATDDGFMVLEGNGRSDVNLLQVHGPLLSDWRTLTFYRQHGVVRRRVAVH